MSRPIGQPRSKTPERKQKITFLSAPLQESEEEEWKKQKEEMKTRKIAQENIKPLVLKIIKAIFNKPKDDWPRTEKRLLKMFNDGVMDEGVSAADARDFEAVYHEDIKKFATRRWKEAQKDLEYEARVERYQREEEKEEEERQKLCKNFGICSVAGLAAAGAGAVVGAPVIATTAAAAAAAAAVGRYRGAFGGRKKTRKRQRKSKRKSRRKKRKKRKKRKTRRLRRKSR